GMQSLVRDLNHAYTSHPALHARDCEPEGFEWLITDDHENSVFAWVRHAGSGSDAMVACVSNFTPVARDGYTLPLPKAGNWREVLNTDAEAYWGTGRGNLGGVMAVQTPSHGKPASAKVTLPPLATVYFVSER
ncbi:MAG: alpha amylase C-terminal domain-containing protein, partial [Rhizobiales bacterium]|nr:alpha amylase C-terminal domain-containing protein [Hyphomicrobiales bacterium]